MGENAEIEYDIYYDGDAIEGTVTFTGTTPTFTPTTSLQKTLKVGGKTPAFYYFRKRKEIIT